MALEHGAPRPRLARRLPALAIATGLLGGCNAILGISDVTERAAAGTTTATTATTATGSGGHGGAGGAGGAGVGGAGGATDHCPPKDVGKTACTGHLADCSGSGQCETNLATDSKHCGACDHDCLGAACVDGACQETAFSPNYGDAETFGSLAVQQHRVYYAVAEPGGAKIFWVPTDKPSTKSATLAAHDFGDAYQLVVAPNPDKPNDPTESVVYATSFKDGQWAVCAALVVDGTTDCTWTLKDRTAGIVATDDAVYVAEQHRIVKCYGPDCTEVLAQPGAAIRGLLLDGTTFFFSTYPDGAAASKSGALHRASLDGKTHDVIADGLGQPEELAVDDGWLYFTDSALGQIGRVPKKGAKQPPAVVQTNVPLAYHLALVDGVLYFSADGGFYRLPLCAAPGTPERLTNVDVGGVVTDGPRVFATDLHEHQILGFVR
jgi:hypothetical protein